MNLKNLKTCVELRSENPMEAKSVFTASRRSYSPRMAGLMQNEDQMIVLTREEVPEFVRGVGNDVDVNDQDKWAMQKLLSEYLAGNISDRAAA